MNKPLLTVDKLCQYFKVSGNFAVKAVDGVSFEIFPGETYGLVGESGSGKSTIGRCIAGLINPTSGKILFNGSEQFPRKDIQMIFQDPMSSLNPRKKIDDIIGEGLDINKLCADANERRELIAEMLRKVGLSAAYMNKYPHQLSGGQRQRIGIARALILRPKLIIADECISALDVSIQAQIVNLLKDIQTETKCTYLFITHNLSMVKYISDRIGILQKGHLVETGTTDEIFANPAHEYTRQLLNAILQPNPKLEKRRRMDA